MKDMGLVYGSAAQAKPLIVGVDTVYVHTDIQKVDRMPNGETVENMWCYHETQYTLAEYLNMQISESQRLAVKQLEVEEELTQTQLALAEIAGLLGGVE